MVDLAQEELALVAENDLVVSKFLEHIVNVLNDVGAVAWKYEGQEDAAEIVIHQIVGALLKEIPMTPEIRSNTLSGLGYSQNAFD